MISMDNRVFVTIIDGATPEDLPPDIVENMHDKMFQIHIHNNKTIRLVPIKLADSNRCPVIIGNEQCGCTIGHGGKHMWGSGD